MFTALVVSRLLITSFYEIGFKDEKYYGKARKRSVIDFVGKWKITFAIAVVCILSGPVAMAHQFRRRQWRTEPEHGFPWRYIDKRYVQ